MLFNRITAMAACLAFYAVSFCQAKQSKIKFGDITPEDFKPAYYAIDSSADAVYLYDWGSSKHEGNTNGWFSVVFTVHERLRLIRKNSFDDLATIKIPVLKWGTEYEKIDDLQAATYNIEDGKVVSAKVDKNSIFKDKDGDIQIIKFTFPNLKEGCIIEYSYKRTIPYSRYIPSWSFQGEYPKLLSEFDLEIPQFFEFVVLKQGYLNPYIDTVNLSADNFHVIEQNGIEASQIYNIRSNTIRHIWAYKNIPPIKEEKFITDLSNYRQGLEFQFSAMRFPNTEPKFYMRTWYETVDQLMKDEDFGADISKENGWLKDDVRQAIQGETDALKKARKIYEYVRDNYTCIDHSAVYLSQPIKKTEQLKKGNVVDINMLMIAMFKIAGYNADPVLLSTREHGKTYDMYPILDKFNYLIAHINIDDKTSYLLDAANPILGFGHLDEECYNGNARLIAATPNLINLSADSLHESQVISLFLSNDEEGDISGTYRQVMGEMESVNMRKKMKKTNKEDYFKDVKKSYSFDVKLNNKSIDSLNQPEMPVSVQYDVSFKPDGDIIYFSPMSGEGSNKENPFTAAERSYPVEMPYCPDETFVLNMEVPKGYKVDELPKSSRITLNETEGMFEYLIQQTGDNIQLRCRTKLNKATFEPDDYETLRNFFAFVVEKEGEQIVFKKQ